MKSIGSRSLVQQFVGASVALSAGIILILAVFVSAHTYTMMRDQMQANLQAEVHGTRKLLDTAYGISVGLTDRVAGILASNFPAGFTVADGDVAQVGALTAPVLRYQGQALNLDYRVVDEFSRTTGGVATLFVRQGDDFIRVTTSLKDENGARAIGTQLPHDHPAYRKVLAGDTYLGMATLFGKPYMAKYVPAKDAHGKLVGILFVGFDLTPVLENLKTTIAEQKFGASGYAFVMQAGTQEPGKLMFHPTLAGKNLVREVRDAAGGNPFETLLKQEQGLLTYPWSDAAGQTMTRLTAFERTDSWGGVVVAGGGFVEEHTQESRRLRNIVLLACAGAALILGGLLWLFMARQLRPVAQVVHMLERIGAGDMTVRTARRIPADTRNELDVITRSIDATARQVGALIGDLRQNAVEVEQTARNLADTATTLNDTASTQHESAAAMAAGVEEMAVSVNHVSDNAQHSSEFTQHTLGLSQEGRAATSAVLTQMTQIETSVTGAAGHIERLDGDAQRISAVVSIIKEVADQTNLLALNAAIEAARAGEQGRGFAVVADEVRRTGKSTLEISDMVGSIQSGAHDAAVGMREAVELVRSGVTAVDSARQVISEIESGAASAVQAASEIAAALKEQAAASNSIGRDVERISGLSEQTADSAHQSAQAVAHLEALAERMSNAVARFTVLHER